MKERPIIMQAESVKAILEGRKSQTRRVIKPQPSEYDQFSTSKNPKPIPIHLGVDGTQDIWAWTYPEESHGGGWEFYCPYGQEGDLLWVRETWATYACYNRYKPSQLQEAFTIWKQSEPRIFYKAEVEYPHQFKWRPSIFMPRWASRITLEITEVRVERVRDIRPAGCLAEGVPLDFPQWRGFAIVWDKINGKKHPWSSNPWVWVISFKMEGRN